ncbi:MAG TPA: glycosyltransferase [Vicinamibacterales bacterium]|nr:glycosyltransferase [Vicinamibacterales bacterium]
MRILLIADPYIAVPPAFYGGIERVVADLADEYHRRGHEVSLWAAPGSGTDAARWTFGRQGEWTRWSNFRNTVHLGTRLAASMARYDVVHNFGRLAYLWSIMPARLRKLQTYMRHVNPRNMRLAARLHAHNLHFTAVSRAIRATGAPGGGTWHVVYNSAEPARYQFVGSVPADAPLVFLGRFERCKGAHTAIEVARRTNRTLLLAGTESPLPQEQRYFEQEVKPLIDGRLIQFVGPVDDKAKQDLLGRAAALLLPVEWEEPFPVVLPEALLCGTPVVSFRRGGNPEGIIHGETGYVCDTVEDMADAVQRVSALSRASCRADAERRFSTRAIADAYLRVYETGESGT